MIDWLGDAILDWIAWELGSATGEAIGGRRRQLTELQVRRRLRIHATMFIVALGCILSSMLRPAWDGSLYLFLAGIAVAVISLAAFLELRRLPHRAARRSSN